MGVTAVRVAACAGVLVGGILLGDCAVGLALADTGGGGSASGDEQSSKDIDSTVTGPTAAADGAAGESRAATPPTFGAQAQSGDAVDESKLSTLSEVPGPEPEVAGNADRGTGSGGTVGGAVTTVPTAQSSGGSSNADSLNNVAVVGRTAPQKEAKAAAQSQYFPFLPGVFLEVRVRRGGGDWWNADQIMTRLGEALMPAPPAPPAPTPALRSKEAPVLEAPVLDASGGDGGDGGGGGSDYRATGFDGAPVLHAPVVVAPVMPAAGAGASGGAGSGGSASAPPAITGGAGSGSARVSGVDTTGASTIPVIRWGTAPAQSPAIGTVTPLSGQAPRQGFTDVVRTAGVPQLAGAALPGVAGILFMTFGGGVIGYRQASAGWMIRTSPAARYLP